MIFKPPNSHEFHAAAHTRALLDELAAIEAEIVEEVEALRAALGEAA